MYLEVSESLKQLLTQTHSVEHTLVDESDSLPRMHTGTKESCQFNWPSPAVTVV